MEVRPQKTLFGRADLTAVYRKSRDLLVQHGVFRIVRVTTYDDGSSSLVICNLWRVERSNLGAITAFEFDLSSEQWREVTEFDHWPDVPLYPIQKAQTLDWWRDVVRRVVWKALMAAGYGALPRHISEIQWGFDEQTGQSMMVSGKPEMTPDKMAYSLVQRYIGKVVGHTKAGKQKWRKGFLKPKVMTAGAKALRAAIFEHVLNADLLSAILAIDYKLVTLRDYLRYAVRQDDILRVAHEHRNLLPLLPEISEDYWGRTDLFSRQLWVKDGRRRTVVDYARFSKHKGLSFASFDTRSAFRWLGKTQLTVVRRWSSGSGGRKNVAVLENLSRANITAKIPAIAWSHIVVASAGHRLAQLGVSEWVQRLYRAFAEHCAEMWKEQGFAALKLWLKSVHADLGDLADWLSAEGIAQGFPDKHATWVSLKRRCNAWHERVAVENIERNADANRTWESLLDEVTIDGVTFTPLNSVKDVSLEGYLQHHCVGQYVYECVAGVYRVFAAIEPDGTHSTLGLCLDRSGRWSVEQHRGKYNAAVSPEAAKAGRELARQYHQSHMHKTGQC